MNKSPRHGMWWFMLAAGVAWLIVIAPALSILGAEQATGLLVNAASAVTIGAFFAVPALMTISIMLEAHDHCRAAQRARTFTVLLVLSLLAVAGVLVASAIIVASRAGAPIADGQDDSHPRLLSPHGDARAAEIRIR